MAELKQLVVSELKPALAPTLVVDNTGLALVADFFKRAPEFGFDTETNVVPKFTQRKLRTIQVGDRAEQYVIDLLAFAGSPERLIEQGWKKTPAWAGDVVDTLRTGLDSKDHVKVGANLQFDYETMLWCLGLRSWNFYDVQLVEKVIYTGRVNFFVKGFWALDDLVARYCGLQISKDEQTSFDLETPLTQTQIEYAALDTRLPLAVKAAQVRVVEKAALTGTVYLENSAIPAFGDMHVNGVYLDRDSWRKLIAANKEKHAANVKALDTFFSPVVGAKSQPNIDVEKLEAAWRDTPKTPEPLWEDKDGHFHSYSAWDESYGVPKPPYVNERAEARKRYQEANRTAKAWVEDSKKWEGEAAINYGSNPQLLAALRKMGLGAKILPSTNDKLLAKFSDRPAVKAIQDYRETSKLLSTYGERWLDNIDPDTGRVHSRINQMGADSGRTSSVNPNTQQLPKVKAYRACFKARPGYKIVGVDMSGCQLRIMADDAYQSTGDDMWVVAFENDWDVHSVGAAAAEPEKWESCALENCEFTKKKAKCECTGHKKLRDDNKSTNFGVAFGMEEYSLAAKLHISKDEAAKKLAKWRVVNKGVNDRLNQSGEEAKRTYSIRTMGDRRRLFNKPDWSKASAIAIEREAEDAKKANRHPRVVDSKMIGRVYYAQYGSIEREGKNTRIQGTEADIAKTAMGAGFDRNGKPFMWHLLPKFGAETVLMVHDEVVGEVPAEHAEGFAEMVQDCFLRAGEMFLKRVKMTSDSHIGDCWSK